MRLVPCISDHYVRGPPCVRTSLPTSPLPLPVWERKEARGKGRARQPCAAAPGRKTLPPSHRGRATQTLPANGAHQQRSGTYRWECHWRTASTIQVFDHTLTLSGDHGGRKLVDNPSRNDFRFHAAARHTNHRPTLPSVPSDSVGMSDKRRRLKMDVRHPSS